MDAYNQVILGESLEIDEARQMKDPKKDSMVAKNGKTIVIDKSKEKEYLKKGWTLAEKSKLDPVDDKANDKKFKDRKDKDIDNDGDVDSSDEYLHKKRAATDDAIDGGKKPAKNVKKEEEDEEESDEPKKKKPFPPKKDGEEKDEEESEDEEDKEKPKVAGKKDDKKKVASNAKTAEISKIGEDVELEEGVSKTYKGNTIHQVGKHRSSDDKVAYKLSNADAKTLNKFMKSASAKERTQMHNMFWDTDEKDTDNVTAAKGPKMAIAYAKKKINEDIDLTDATTDLLNMWESAAKKSVKGVTDKGEEIDSKQSPKAKEFDNSHDKSEKDIEDNVEDAKKKSKSAEGGTKANSGKRPVDNAAGDKNIVKSTEVKEETAEEVVAQAQDIINGKTVSEIADMQADKPKNPHDARTKDAKKFLERMAKRRGYVKAEKGDC